jgi:predicted nucleic acid-binding protein
VIVLDTSAIVALADRKEPAHRAVVDLIAAERGPLVIPSLVLCEIGYFLGRRAGSGAVVQLLGDIAVGAFDLDCGDPDIARCAELVERYADLPLGLADASVVACAERRGRRVLTLDRRDFDVVGGEVGLTILP